MSPLLNYRPLATPVSFRCSDELLADLIALNEDMIEQLQLERLSEKGTTDFLGRMIDQHMRAAAMLRAELGTTFQATD